MSQMALIDAFYTSKSCCGLQNIESSIYIWFCMFKFEYLNSEFSKISAFNRGWRDVSIGCLLGYLISVKF